MIEPVNMHFLFSQIIQFDEYSLMGSFVTSNKRIIQRKTGSSCHVKIIS